MHSNDDLDARLWDIDLELGRFAVPIYCTHGKRAPALVGTGFFVQIGPVVFIATAGHVLAAEREGELVVPGTRELYRLPPMFRSTARSASDPDLDIAFDQLHPVLAKALSRYARVPVSWTGPNHVPDEAYVYSLVGFPSSRNKPGLRSKMVRAVLHRYQAHTLDLTEHERLGLDPALHLALGHRSLNIKNRDGSLRQPPTPTGISGCAVWCLGPLEDVAAGKRVVSLVGIAIRKVSKPAHFQCTRIALLLESVRDLFPALSQYIPRSEYVEVDFHLG